MYNIKFYAQIVRALDEIGAPYMIVGAFAGIPFGITRTTYDIDILVDLREQDFEVLSAALRLWNDLAAQVQKEIQNRK